MKTGNYSFHITLEEPAFLPFYKGSTFRGVLGHALKRIICALKHTSCKDCMLKTHCAYALVFETRHARPAPKGHRISDAPHPLVIEPPLTPRQTFARGDSLRCNLKLFGEINQHLPYFVYAFEQMGKLGIGKQVPPVHQLRLRLITPLLIMGQTVHAGKNTAFGLGKYTLEIETQ